MRYYMLKSSISNVDSRKLLSANLKKRSNTLKQADELLECVWLFCGVGA